MAKDNGAAGMVEIVSLDDLRLDPGLQPRADEWPETVEEYADWLREDVSRDMPPVEAVRDSSGVLWVWDGFQRAAAYRDAERKCIPAHVVPGTRRDALLLSLGANAAHGRHRTNKDKVKVVDRALHDPEWSKWSDREIARVCGVGKSFVGKIRMSLSTVDSVSGNRTYMRQDGTEGQMNTSHIGKSKSGKANERNGVPQVDKDQSNSTETSESKTGVGVDRDALGIPVQEHAREAFAARPQFDDLLAKLRECRRLYSALADQPGGAYLTRPGKSMNARDAWRHKGIEQAIMDVEDCRPTYTVCPNAYDPRHPHEGCPLCHGLNWTRPLSRQELADKKELFESAKEAHGVSA